MDGLAIFQTLSPIAVGLGMIAFAWFKKGHPVAAATLETAVVEIQNVVGKLQLDPQTKAGLLQKFLMTLTDALHPPGSSPAPKVNAVPQIDYNALAAAIAARTRPAGSVGLSMGQPTP